MKTSRASNGRKYTYNAHRLQSLNGQDEVPVVYHYDNYGRVDTLYDESGLVCYQYGNMGEITRETRIYTVPFLANIIALNTQFEYDSWGRILNITYPDNEEVNYSYDFGGQLERIANNQNYTYLDSIQYNKFGAKISQKYGNGIQTKYTYYPLTQRLDSLLTTYRGNTLSYLQYNYDSVGNILRVNSSYPMPQYQVTERYSYDSADQLLTAESTCNNNVLCSGAYSYNNWGKINTYTQQTTDPATNISENKNYRYYFPGSSADMAQGQTSFAPIIKYDMQQNPQPLETCTYGINGSIRKRYDHPTQNTDYYYFNASGNLKACGTDMQISVYGYNSANTRTYKVNLFNANQWVNGQPQPIQPMVQNAMFYPNTYLNFNGNGEYTKHYYNGMERIASRLGDNTTTIAINNNILENRKLQLEDQFREDIHKLIEETVPIDMPPFIDVNALQPTGTPNDIYYYHPNHLGSTSFVTDQNQTITQGFLYAPFGEITTEYNINFGNNVIPKYSFNAKELDEETEMYYYEARYYAPPTFTSRDPHFEKYFWMSPYAYCTNNPVKYVDPMGEYYIKPPSKKDNTYRVQVTNFNWVRKVSITTAVPLLGYFYEGMLAYQRLKDPSFNATTSDYFGLGFQLLGGGSVKFLAKFGKIDGFGKILLKANRQMVASLMSAFSNPETSEIALEYMAIRSLENEGKGIVISNSLNNVREYSFTFKKSITDKIEKEILSDKNLISQKKFNLEEEVTKRLEVMINNKKEEIRKSLIEE